MNKRLTIAAMVFASAFAFVPIVKADTWDNIILAGNYLSDYYLEHNESSTMHAHIGNYTAESKNLLVKIKLYDHSNMMIKEDSWDNRMFSPYSEQHFMLTSPMDLKHGQTYHFTVEIYKAGTSELIRRYDMPQSFKVAIDYTGPEMNLNMPNNDQHVYGNTLSFMGTAMDWQSGVEKVVVHSRTTGTTYTASYNSSNHQFMQDINMTGWTEGYHGFDVTAYNKDGVQTYKYVGIVKH